MMPPLLTDDQSQDDGMLMQRIASRDADSLRALYDRYSSLVFAVCLRIVRDRQEAENLVVDIFWEIWDKSARYDASRGRVLSYLMMVSRSRALDQKRKSSRLGMTIADPTGAAERVDNSDPSSDALLGEQRQIVRRTLDQLEPVQRQAIECAYYDGLSHSEIAEKLKRPLGTVKTQIRSGLARLRDALNGMQST
jgi:RNA polymerase sigma-70 factor, ECF subfamily